MENLFKKSIQRINAIDVSFKRFLYHDIDWEYRLIGIKGARGTGKTTLILQYIKENLKLSYETLYVSMDKFYFTENKLTDLTDEFVKNGGKYLFLDEVHKYPTWSQEIKNIYDDYPDLKIVFTGSSVLEIIKAEADLSRRALIYTLPELSLREYLELMYKIKIPVFNLAQILDNHLEISKLIINEIKPVPI
ncbi:MAG: AAA family ATPase, partial [Desulfobacteraceae bacterium]|nr:AAA family ATPase [Desulfobacteraceae bacterium]